MEENGNQNPVQPSNNFSFYEDEKKKKKGMGPIKGLLLAIVIAVIICCLGLLVRMVIAGDGDYFKPIKNIFGIEDEKEKKSPNRVEDKAEVSPIVSSLSGERYSLLTSDVEDEDVKHYRMTIDVNELMENLYDQMSDSYQNSYNNSNLNNSFDDDQDDDYNDFDNNDDDSDYFNEDNDFNNRNYDSDYYNEYNDDYDDGNDDFSFDEEDSNDNYFKQTMSLRYNDDNDILSEDDNYDDEISAFDDNEEDTDRDLSSDDIYSDKRFRSSFDTDENDATDYNDDSIESKIQDYASSLGMMMSLMGDQIKDIISGEVYFDIYFQGNEIVQIVLGADYGDLIQNLYDYMMDNADDDSLEEMESEGVNSAEDFADYILDKINEEFDINDVYDEMFNDETFKESLTEIGLTEQNLKDAIDIHFDRGIAEFYFTGSTKINKAIKKYFESDEFKEELNSFSEEYGEVDEDNIIEDMIKLSNDEESSEYGIEFVEIN